MLTPTKKRALEILRDYPGLTPRAFGHKLWPDHPGWQRHTKCGPKGTSHGGGMNLASGGFLGKLKKEGLVRVEYARYHHAAEHYITEEGLRALREDASDA
jgi:hypothetical protein